MVPTVTVVPPAQPTQTPTAVPTITPIPSPTPFVCDYQGEEALRFLALGDSYTIGEGVAAAERWPNQLTAVLQARGVSMAPAEIIARTGWTTDELMFGISDADPQGPYDLVSLLIGVNNQYRGRGLAEYREQLQVLLRRAIAFAGDRPARVLVLSIPDWSVVPFAADDRRTPAEIAAEIDQFNGVNKEEAAAAGAHYVDITKISRLAAQDPTLVAEDGLHPSGAMYGMWVEEMLPVVCGMLREQ